MAQREGDVMTVWVSQPTRTELPVSLNLKQFAGDALVSDSEDRVRWQDGSWQIDTKGLNGRTYKFSYRVQ